MGYTIYIDGEEEIMAKHFLVAEIIAKDWCSCYNVDIVDNSTGEVICQYPKSEISPYDESE